MANLSDGQKIIFVNYLLKEGLNPAFVQEILQTPWLAKAVMESLQGHATGFTQWTNIPTDHDAPRISYLSESGLDLDSPSTLKTHVPSHLHTIDRTLSVEDIRQAGIRIDESRPPRKDAARWGRPGPTYVEIILAEHQAALPKLERTVPITLFEAAPGGKPVDECRKIAALPYAALDGWGLVAIAKQLPDKSERYIVSFFGVERTGRVLVLANMIKFMLLTSMPVHSPLPDKQKVRVPMRPPLQLGT